MQNTKTQPILPESSSLDFSTSSPLFVQSSAAIAINSSSRQKRIIDITLYVCDCA